MLGTGWFRNFLFVLAGMITYRIIFGPPASGLTAISPPISPADKARKVSKPPAGLPGISSRKGRISDLKTGEGGSRALITSSGAGAPK